MHSPCTGCGRMLEHDHDPRTVICAGCEIDRFGVLASGTPELLLPPPTVELRKLYEVPPCLEPGYRVLTIAFCVAFGFIGGWIARGGS